MNTQQRLFLLNNFSRHLDQKILKIDKQKDAFLQTINSNNHDINFESLPKIEIINDLAAYHKQIDKTITQTYQSISSVMSQLSNLKNRKQNTSKLQDALASISMIKSYSLSLKLQLMTDLQQLHKALSNYYEIRNKSRYCDNYIKQIDEEIVKIQQKYRKQFDNQLTKTNSASIKDLSKILQVIKVNKKKIETMKLIEESSKNTRDNHNKMIQGNNRQAQKNIQLKSSAHQIQLSQISQFYISMVKKQLVKFQQELFNIPIISPNASNQTSYIFFQIIKNSLKTIASIIQTYQSNIIKLQSLQGLHTVIVNVFKYVTENLILEILIREKKYYQIDKILISRNKLTIKSSQYKVLKSYFKEFNAIWNQIERFRIHLYSYIQDKQQYSKKSLFNKQLIDIVNSSKFVQFNYEIILYFQAFFRHQLDRLLKKSPFIVSLWQLDEQFLKQVRQKNEFKSNLSGQDFIEEMILKFSDGIKKSFQTLNILIVSALINFINHNLIYEDSFYAFNQLLQRFCTKITQSKAIQGTVYIIPHLGLVIMLNTLSSYPKAVKSAFQQLEIPEQLPKERIQNQISQLIHNCKQKTGEFIGEAFDKILAQPFILQKITYQSNLYQQVITKMFQNLQKDLLALFVYKMSKVHVQLILQQQFRQEQKYSHMEVLSLEKQVRNVINFYESKSHSIRQNFKRILDYIEVLLAESEGSLKKLIDEWKNKYQEVELRQIWKMRTGN